MYDNTVDVIVVKSNVYEVPVPDIKTETLDDLTNELS